MPNARIGVGTRGEMRVAFQMAFPQLEGETLSERQ